MTEAKEGRESTPAVAGCYGKTSPAPSPRIKKRTSSQSSRKSSGSQTRKHPMCLYLRKAGPTQDASWESMENGRWPTELWTQNSGEFPKEEAASTLSQILEALPHPKYFLSEAACLGILRRAEKRGKELPDILKQTLIRQAGGAKLIPLQVEWEYTQSVQR